MARGTEKRGAADALLLHGEERFLVDERARATLDQWGKDLVSDFGLDTMEGAGLAPARLQDAVLQAPFLDPYRVVHVRMVPANLAEGLAGAVQEIPSTTRLLMTVAGRIGPTNKLAKAVSAAGGQVIEMQHLKGRALGDWAARRAVDKHGLTPAIAAQVVRVAPPDLSIIDSELTKVAAYKASGAKLTNEVVSELLAGGREDEIFKLTDNLLPRPTPQALAIARNLTRGGMQPTSVAYRMARHYALVLEVIVRQVREIHRRIREKIRVEDGVPAMIEASLTTIRLAGENQYLQLLTRPDSAGLTARLAESDIVMGLQRELWYPMLEAARDRGELRTDRHFDDLIRWITFLEFSLITSAEAFGLAGEADCRDALSAYLVPALRP